MKKRILSIILSIVMLAGLLPATALAAGDEGDLYIGGVALPSGSYYINGGTVSDTEPSDWNARYDGSTLTIKNLSVVGKASSNTPESAGIYYNDSDGSTPLTLVIEGANSVTGGDTSGLTGSYSSFGIYSGDALTIEGDGALSVSGGTVAYIAGSFGIYAQNDLMVKGGVINATGGTASGTGSSYGIGLYNSGACGMTVKGGTLNTTGGTADSGSSAGIYAAFDSQFVNIDGGILVATGGAGNNSYGIYNSQSNMENNTVTATGGILVARAGSGTNTNKAIEGTLTNTDTQIAGQMANGTFTGSPTTYNADATAVVIVPNSYTDGSDLFTSINDNTVTLTGNSYIVKDSGSALTLTNTPTINTGNHTLLAVTLHSHDSIAHGINGGFTASGGGAVIAVSGTGESSYGSDGINGNLTVTDAAVTAIGGPSGRGVYYQYDQSSTDPAVTVTDGTLNALGGSGGGTSMGIGAGVNQPLSVSGGTVNAVSGAATGSVYGIFGSVTVNGGTVNAAAGPNQNRNNFGVGTDTGSVAVTGGTLNAVGGVSNNESSYGVSASSVSVSDAGSIHAVGRTYGLSAQSGSLAGGSFTGGTAAVQQKTYNGIVSALLAKGYGFYAGNSQLDSAANTVGDPYQTVTVKPAAPAVTEVQWGDSADSLTGKGTLADAFAASPAYIRLQSSVTLAAGITVADSDITLDLNGKTITGAVDVTPITVSGGALTITDTAATKGGVTGGNGRNRRSARRIRQQRHADR